MGLLTPFSMLQTKPFECRWRSPSNIAFVKYWGKKGHQLPANPSVSLTLKECYTETSVVFNPSDSLSVNLELDGKNEPKFAEKIKSYLLNLSSELSFLQKLDLRISTLNTFPHGAGIASSASGLSAFCLGLTSYLYALRPEEEESLFLQRASHLSRLASGSACRSVYGGFVTWGESSLVGGHDEYASPLKVHPELEYLQDSILVISADEKVVSSRAGHERMKEHAYAAARFVEAHKNFADTIKALRIGDMERVGTILENEALQLHAMMLTAPESFTLLKPNTLAAIELVRDFRFQTKIPLYFTLDAGPNLHLIYPDSYKNKISIFIANELAPLAVNVIHDQRGEGPLRCH
jgi:diphosphomevalonate decarboxylase